MLVKYQRNNTSKQSAGMLSTKETTKQEKIYQSASSKEATKEASKLQECTKISKQEHKQENCMNICR